VHGGFKLQEEEKTKSFGQLVVAKAISSTRKTFDSLPKDLFIAIFSLVAGFLTYKKLYGWPDAVTEFVSAFAFGLAPFGLIVLLSFLWNLWLAPMELAYEAWRDSLILTKPAPINWSIWQKRSRYSIDDLAAILAKVDPTLDIRDSNKIAYSDLILEEVKNGKLQYIRRYSDITPEQELPLAKRYTQIERNLALRWAIEKSIPVDHFG
jgi:hypothetical protein